LIGLLSSVSLPGRARTCDLRLKAKAGLPPDVNTCVAISFASGSGEPGSFVPILVIQQRPPPFKNQPCTAKGRYAPKSVNPSESSLAKYCLYCSQELRNGCG
jgi:hypothetical protein